MKRILDATELFENGLSSGFDSEKVWNMSIAEVLEKGLPMALRNADGSEGEPMAIRKFLDLKWKRVRGVHRLLVTVDLERAGGNDKAEKEARKEEFLSKLGTSAKELKASFDKDTKFWGAKWAPEVGDAYTMGMVGKTNYQVLMAGLRDLSKGNQRDAIMKAGRTIQRWQAWVGGWAPGR
jgi:hypothetical protein